MNSLNENGDMVQYFVDNYQPWLKNFKKRIKDESLSEEDVIKEVDSKLKNEGDRKYILNSIKNDKLISGDITGKLLKESIKHIKFIKESKTEEERLARSKSYINSLKGKPMTDVERKRMVADTVGTPDKWREQLGYAKTVIRKSGNKSHEEAKKELQKQADAQYENKNIQEGWFSNKKEDIIKKNLIKHKNFVKKNRNNKNGFSMVDLDGKKHRVELFNMDDFPRLTENNKKRITDRYPEAKKDIEYMFIVGSMKVGNKPYDVIFMADDGTYEAYNIQNGFNISSDLILDEPSQ